MSSIEGTFFCDDLHITCELKEIVCPQKNITFFDLFLYSLKFVCRFVLISIILSSSKKHYGVSDCRSF